MEGNAIENSNRLGLDVNSFMGQRQGLTMDEGARAEINGQRIVVDDFNPSLNNELQREPDTTTRGRFELEDVSMGNQ